MESLKPAIIILTETWLKPNIPDSLIKIPGYDIYRDDRIGKRSGGVAIYASNKINYLRTKLNINYNTKFESAEFLCLDVEIGVNKFLVCGLCRGHDSTVNQDNMLLDHLGHISENSTVIIMGDFNYSGVRWPLDDSGYLTPKEQNFIEWYKKSNLEQLVDQNTRFRRGNQPSILDLILTNDELLISNVDHQALIGKSGYYLFPFKSNNFVELYQDLITRK